MFLEWNATLYIVNDEKFKQNARGIFTIFILMILDYNTSCIQQISPLFMVQ